MNDQPSEKPSLETLNKHLDALKKTQGSEATAHAPKGDAAKAAIDFASASAVGALLGYGLDSYCNTSPWGIVGGLVLGVVTGVYIMLKAEAVAQARKQDKGND